ncbi:MAG: hypothetical protein Q9190_005292 [Brigantiaea leucoxantha]
MAAQAQYNVPDTSLFHELDNYPWSEDVEFQSGLNAILASNSDPQQVEHLTLRARCFYYSRKHDTPIDFESYKAWRLASQPRPTSTPAPVLEPPAPYPTSFSQIVDLITKGEPIPGIKDVPDTVLTGHESMPTTAKRKKPWEETEESSYDKSSLAAESAKPSDI